MTDYLDALLDAFPREDQEADPEESLLLSPPLSPPFRTAAPTRAETPLPGQTRFPFDPDGASPESSPETGTRAPTPDPLSTVLLQTPAFPSEHQAASASLPLLEQHRRLTRMAAQPLRQASAPHPQHPAPTSQSDSPLPTRRLDRLFQRDARRYDGGFTLF